MAEVRTRRSEPSRLGRGRQSRCPHLGKPGFDLVRGCVTGEAATRGCERGHVSTIGIDRAWRALGAEKEQPALKLDIVLADRRHGDCIRCGSYFVLQTTFFLQAMRPGAGRRRLWKTGVRHRSRTADVLRHDPTRLWARACRSAVSDTGLSTAEPCAETVSSCPQRAMGLGYDRGCALSYTRRRRRASTWL